MIDRRGFLGALLALPFLRLKRWGGYIPAGTRPALSISKLREPVRLTLHSASEGRISQAWVDYFERMGLETRVQIARINAMSRALESRND